MKKTVLAFDFGASSGRAIKGEFDGENLLCTEIHRFENNPIMHEGKLCWDFYTLQNEVRTAIDKAGKVDGIAFDTWGVDYGLIDRDNNLIGLPVCYRDERTHGVSKKAFEKMPGDALYAKTGTQIMDINTLFQLITDDLSEAKTMLFMPDLFAFMLCGKAVCEQSIASTSQILSPTTLEWCDEVTSTFDIPKSLFAPIVKSGTVIGEYKDAKVIAVAGHDTESAVAALPTEDSDVAFISCGTWSLLGTELDEPILTKESYTEEFSNEIGANGKVNYLKNITGLWLIQESRRYWKKNGEVYSYADLERMARECTTEVASVDVDEPEFATPGNMPVKICEYCERNGLPVPKSPAEIILCIYKSLAKKYASSLSQLSEVTGKKFTAVHILGGGANDAFLCELTAKYCRLPVFAGPTEATALGNIILQLVALGALKDVAQGRKIIAKTEKIKEYSVN